MLLCLILKKNHHPSSGYVHAKKMQLQPNPAIPGICQDSF